MRYFVNCILPLRELWVDIKLGFDRCLGVPSLSGLVPPPFPVPSVSSSLPFSPGSLPHNTMEISISQNLVEGQCQAFMSPENRFVMPVGFFTQSICRQHLFSLQNTDHLSEDNFIALNVLVYQRWRKKRTIPWRGKDILPDLPLKNTLSSFYLGMKRKQMTDGRASLEMLNHFHKDIPANSPNVKTPAMLLGVQMYPLLSGEEQASTASSWTTVSGKTMEPLVWFPAKWWHHQGIWFPPYIKED